MFIERVAPGAFTRTFAEDTIRCLFSHGHDPVIGSKPLGLVEELAEDSRGARYVVALSATSFAADVRELAKDGLLGASFRFRALREDVDDRPGRSEHNPDGIPERTLRECRVYEFGPCPFPAYENADLLGAIR